MTDNQIAFHNEVGIRVQAQVFAGRTLLGTCVLGPGESHTLIAEARRYDIFLKNGTTGWELARRLDCECTSVTLRSEHGRYVLVGSRE